MILKIETDTNHLQTEPESFASDLETPRTFEEKDVVYSSHLDAVRDEQQRLRSETNPDIIISDQITGDRPIISPYDAIKTAPVLISPELAAHALTKRFYRLWFFLHPQRINSLKRFYEKGYKPTDRIPIPVIEDAIRKNTELDFSDLGFSFEAKPIDNEEIAIKARPILASGQYSWIATNLPAIPYALSSMPDVSNSFSMATHAIAGGVTFAPFDSLWNKFDTQKKVVDRAWEIVQNDPLIQTHPDREFLLTHIKRLLGTTLKTSSKGVKDMEKYLDEGFTTFRFYNARSKNSEIITTAREAAKQLAQQKYDSLRPFITLFWGQITTAEQALELYSIFDGIAGISFVDGVGGGGICGTPGETALHVNNLKTGYKILQSGVLAPVMFDGGTGDRLPIIGKMGGAGAFKSGAIAGGTIEQPPTLWYYLIDEYLAKLLSGEAGFRTKYLGGKTDYLDEPIFVEGADESVVMNPYVPTIAQADYLLIQSLATAMVFTEVNTFNDFPNTHLQIRLATENVKERSRIHHVNGLGSVSPISYYYPGVKLTSDL